MANHLDRIVDVVFNSVALLICSWVVGLNKSSRLMVVEVMMSLGGRMRRVSELDVTDVSRYV
jgi:hypothetical protein